MKRDDPGQDTWGFFGPIPPPRRKGGRPHTGQPVAHFRIRIPRATHTWLTDEAKWNGLNASEQAGEILERYKEEAVLIPPEIRDWLDAVARRENTSRDKVLRNLIQAIRSRQAT